MNLKEEVTEGFYNRLETYIAYKFPSNRKGQNASFAPFEEALGLPNATMSKAVKEHKNFYIDRIIKINEIYPELNMNWLFSGEGEMLKTSKQDNQGQSVEGEGRLQNNLNETGSRSANVQGDYATASEGESKMIKYLKEQLAKKDEIIAQKDKRIERLTDKLLGD